MGAFGKVAHKALNLAGINLLGVDFDAEKRRKEQQEAIQQAQLIAAGLLSPQAGAIRQSRIGNNEGEDITDAFAPQYEQGPSRSRRPEEIAAGLAELSARVPGFNAKPYLDFAQYAKPGAPQVIEGPDGIYERSPEGGWVKAQPYPAPTPNIPFGWEIGPNGNPRPKPGGPADPAYIAQTAGVRRDAVVQRPMPRAPSRHKPNEIKWD